MRMTRAALRAQEAEEDLQSQIEGKLREQGLSSQSSNDFSQLQIHEDAGDQQTSSSNLSSSEASNEDEISRQALRDITTENYPIALIDPASTPGDAQPEEKSGKKAKGKKGKKVAKKTASDEQDTLDQEQQTEPTENDIDVSKQDDLQAASEMSTVTTELQDLAETMAESDLSQDTSVRMSQTHTELEQKMEASGSSQENAPMDSSTHYEADVSDNHNSGTAETPIKATETVAKTPRFDPTLHLPADQDSTVSIDGTEDSFVESIKTRSPSKISHSFSDMQSQALSEPMIGTPVARTPSQTLSHGSGTSPQRIEDSVEAIDALEDAIEKFAEDLPVLETLPFASPAKTRKTPARSVAKTPVRPASRSPVKTSVRPQAKVASNVSVSPSSKTVAGEPATTSRTLSVDQMETQELGAKMASAKRETVKDRVKAIETRPAPASHRRATSVHVLKKDAAEARPTSQSRHAATKSVSAISQSGASSMSFSNSPVKPAPVQKRTTSGGVLSTSKPAFVPFKSSKAPTVSNFALPGEAVAAKLKAQREARTKTEDGEVKKTAFKARPAPGRAARPSVMPRENKASTARLGARQASGENKENVAPAKQSSSTGAGKSTTASTTAATKKPAAAKVAANSSIRRTAVAPKPTGTIESKKSHAVPSQTSTQANPRITSLTSGQQITLTKDEALQQKLKGKEIYGRIKGSVQQMEEEKKAKEEAARKARAEAAERGRQASREWAEKHKKKVVMMTTVSTEAKSAVTTAQAAK